MAPSPIQFGDYTLLERVRVTDVTQTFRARPHDHRLAEVFVTRLLPTVDDPCAVETFRSQAELAALISHSNLSGIFEVRQARSPAGIGQPDYFAHQAVNGRSLRDVLGEARHQNLEMPAHLACTVAAEILTALHQVHTRQDPRGVAACRAHGELTPDWVFLGFDGSV